MTRYDKPSKNGDRYASAAVGSAALASAGGSAWSYGRRTRLSGLRDVQAGEKWYGANQLASANQKAAEGKEKEIRNLRRTASRRELLAANTRARLVPKATKSKVERYVDPGRPGFYPVNRLRAMDSAAEQGRAQARVLETGRKGNLAEARRLSSEAKSLKAVAQRGARNVIQGTRFARGGRAATLAGVAGAVGFAAVAEAGRGKAPKAKKTPLKQVASSNVIDMNRYRQMQGTRDDRGASLVDISGYKKQVPNANTWLKNNGGQK